MKTAHWTEPYRNAPSTTLEGKIWLAACYLVDATEEQARAIAQIAFGQNTNIWHAAWLFAGSNGRCECACCRRTRKGA